MKYIKEQLIANYLTLLCMSSAIIGGVVLDLGFKNTAKALFIVGGLFLIAAFAEGYSQGKKDSEETK